MKWQGTVGEHVFYACESFDCAIDLLNALAKVENHGLYSPIKSHHW